MCVGLHGFLLPAGFIDGGVTGIALILQRVTGFPLWLLIILCNVPFLILGYRRLGPGFAIRTTIAIALLAAFLFFVHVPRITDDRLLCAVFGGLFIGAGVGLCIRGGAVLDGTEILAILANRIAGTTVGEVILLVNVFIFFTAAFVFGLENALYSVLTYVAATRALDFVTYGVEEYLGVFIISSLSMEILKALVSELGRGATRLHGHGGASDTELDVLFSVATRLELPRVKSLIAERDANAFVVIFRLSDVHGGFVRRSSIARLTA